MWSEEDRAFLAKVDAADHGRAVGKNGLTIWAVQTLIWHAGITETGAPLAVKLVVPAFMAAVALWLWRRPEA